MFHPRKLYKNHSRCQNNQAQAIVIPAKKKKKNGISAFCTLHNTKVVQINFENCNAFPYYDSPFEKIVLCQQRFTISHDFIMHATAIQNSQSTWPLSVYLL